MQTTRSVLVVERDPAVREALTSLLQGMARVVAAASIADAMRGLEDVTRFSAFVVDIALPDGDGLDVLAYARARGSRAHGLVLAAQASEASINRAFDLGARYAVKPFEAERVVGFVHEALSSPSTRLEGRILTWRDRYGLTNAEAEILLAATHGDGFEELVAHREIAASTLKDHVHNLLTKTGDASLLAAVARLLRTNE